MTSRSPWWVAPSSSRIPLWSIAFLGILEDEFGENWGGSHPNSLNRQAFENCQQELTSDRMKRTTRQFFEAKKTGWCFWRRSFPFWEKFWPKIQRLSLDGFVAIFWKKGSDRGPCLSLSWFWQYCFRNPATVTGYSSEILWVRWESFSIYQQYIYGKLFPFHMVNTTNFRWKNIPLWRQGFIHVQLGFRDTGNLWVAIQP